MCLYAYSVDVHRNFSIYIHTYSTYIHTTTRILVTRTSLKHDIQHFCVLENFGIVLPAISRMGCHPRLG